MTYASIAGVKPAVSRIVFGADKQWGLSFASGMYDTFFERGGNAFDTAYAYEKGEAEKCLGHWIRQRGIRSKIALIVKGAHTPLCTPAFLDSQLRESLDRLQTDYADIYFIHRDNSDVPVGEFVDALNEHQRAGRIGAFGGSNWTLKRLQQADAYAVKKGLQRFNCLGNNFSLARMGEPMWKGCLSANDPAFQRWLTKTRTALFAWSSHAYGFFNPIYNDRQPDPLVVRAWNSVENFQRRERAIELAGKKGIDPIHVALAYVLHRPYPSFAVIGPRQISETITSLQSTSVTLTPKELSWLDLDGKEDGWKYRLRSFSSKKKHSSHQNVILSSQPLQTIPHTTLPVAPPSENKSSQLRETCWPNERESLLLQAGLWNPQRALIAWNRFCDITPDIETLDDGCYRLFPLVAANLQTCRPNILHRDRLFGILRHSWAKNQMLLGKIFPLLHALQAADVEFLVLKGVALAALYQSQGGVRPMADIDILIRPHELQTVSTVLGKLGYTPDFALTLDRISELIRFRHELTFKSRDGCDLDVHWYLISDARDLTAEDGFWQEAVPCVLPGLSTRTLHPADQLLHACLHGAQWNEVSPVRWLSDATVLIRAGTDWLRLESQARHLRQLQPVRDTLLFLDRLEIDLPPGIVEHWRGIEVTPIEALEGGYRISRPNTRERTKQLAWVYLRLTRNISLLGLLQNMPAYMNQVHHFRSYARRFKFICYIGFLICCQKRARL